MVARHTRDPRASSRTSLSCNLVRPRSALPPEQRRPQLEHRRRLRLVEPAQQSGGHISLTSSPGAGVSFQIYLPRTLDCAPSNLGEEAPPASAPGSETVLLVEDDEQVRSIAHEILKLHGYRVLSAATPHEALDLSAGFREPIHLVITDVVMPQMNGRELAQRLRRARPNLQVLYMSGYAEKAFDEADALANAAFLQKPITPDLLAHNVRRVLDRRR